MDNIVIKSNSNLTPLGNTVYYLNSSNIVTINIVSTVSNIDFNVANNTESIINLADINNKQNLVINFNVGKNSNIIVNNFLIDTNSTVTFNISILGEKTEVNINSLLLARKKQNTNLTINTINKAHLSVAKTKVQCLLLNDSQVEVTVNGHILKGMKQAENHQKLNGLNEDNSLLKLNPILLIDEYDVNASHAASNGLPDENILFYLMSRGLSLDRAKLLLRESLVLPYIEKITDEDLKKQLFSKLKGVFISE